MSNDAGLAIDIIGAGIGGLTTGIALQQQGIPFRIFEQALQLKPVGAGIMLANNAMQVYKALGFREEIEAKGNPISGINITDRYLKPISSIDLTPFEHKFGVRNVAIHRGSLQTILLNHVNTTIHLGHQLKDIMRMGDGFTLHFDQQEPQTSQALIGADGIDSVIRNKLFPKSYLRHTNQKCWRGIANMDLPSRFRHEINESWHLGRRFGLVQIGPGKVYWFALQSKDRDTDHDDLECIFESFNPLIIDIVRNTPKNQIHTTHISDLKPIQSWHLPNVCLLGDAAHATTPNMGQGACQAIEDAWALAQCLSRNELDHAFTEYQHIRMAKAR